MKLFKSLILGLACVASLTSCEDWLDVNTNPNTPTDMSAEYYQRLAHMQFYTNSATQFAAMRTNMACGDWTRSTRTDTYGAASQWYMLIGQVTTPYQWFFVGAGCNLAQAISTAEAAGAYHYVGAALFIKAYGFMLMTDLYGEMPYTEALGESALPKYDTGKTIYAGCLADIDLAIENFKKTQADGAEPLSVGDSWNNGDVNKWIKACYLLKARWLNKLIKKGAGSAADLKYDATAILEALANAPQSNADNTWINHTDDNSLTHDVLGWDEPVDYSPLYSVIGMNSNYYVTKTLVDNYTNFGGYGVEDPRADKIIPWARSIKTANTPEGLVFENGWRRSIGVDMSTTIRTEGAPYSTSWDAENQCFYCNSETRSGDTVYIHQTSSSKGYAANKNLFYYRDRSGFNEASAMSGSFYTRVSSPTYIATYHEACFIKAEVLYNQGNTAAAFEAYKAGIKASIELMNEKLKVWVSEDANLASCPSFAPMAQEDIDNYLANGIGTAGDADLLGKIMTQKRMAMLFSVENWNDMRRYDYNPEIFLNWTVPAEYYVNTSAQKTVPMGKQPRRWRQCSHEFNYNKDNLQEIGNYVPGAQMNLTNADGSIKIWNVDDACWSLNVWWDDSAEWPEKP